MNWTAKLSSREVVGLLLGATVYGGFAYILSEYFYPICHVPYRADYILGPGIPWVIFFGFLLVNMAILENVRWFAGRERWAFSVAVVAAVGWVILLALSWCTLGQ